MSTQLNTELFSSMIKEKRGSQGLRATAEDIGDVSAATLSRIEQGNLPDVETFIKICRWLGTSTEAFIVSNDEIYKQAPSAQDIIFYHLRSDRTLKPEAAKTLMEVIKHFYQIPI